MAAQSSTRQRRRSNSSPQLRVSASPDPDQELLETEDPALIYLSELIVAGKNIVFLTGAGISKASGIATYRGAADSVWESTLLEWGTRAKFQQDPRAWWNDFWLPKHMLATVKAGDSRTPNAAHRALTEIAVSAKGVAVITQNIDGLHLRSGLPPAQHIEAHGRFGLYKCIEQGCPFAYKESITDLTVEVVPRSKAVQSSQLKRPRRAAPTAAQTDVLGNLPTCPNPRCGKPCLPQTLLFDEDYESHEFYQWSKAERWLNEADGFVFVGTSFSVTLTSEALDVAARKQLPVWDFNITSCGAVTRQGKRIRPLYMVVGESEATLPRLSALVVAQSRVADEGTPTAGTAEMRGSGLVAWPPSPSAVTAKRPWTDADHSLLARLGDNDEPWCDIALKMVRTEEDVRTEWDKVLEGIVPKWTPQEDELLCSLVQRYGTGQWGAKAKALQKPDRLRLDCAVEARWVNVLQHASTQGGVKRARVANRKYVDNAVAPEQKRDRSRARTRSRARD